MLVQGRKKGESLVFQIPPGFSGSFRVMICDVKGNHVRVGTDAPRDVSVVREEILNYPRKEDNASAE